MLNGDMRDAASHRDGSEPIVLDDVALDLFVVPSAINDPRRVFRSRLLHLLDVVRFQSMVHGNE